MYRRGAFRFAFNVGAVVALMLLAATPLFVPHAASQADCRTFPETGKSVCGKFLAYWQEHGGLAQQGYPISEPFQERSEVDGKTYLVQYFERAVFELHPENQPPHDVLLSLLGSLYYAQEYPEGAPGQRPNNSPGSALFARTSKRVGGEFLKYWQEHGGLAQQGYPISDEFMEKSDLDGKEYRVQYFERAVFEYHPENQPPYDVLLSQLGTLRFDRKHATCMGHLKLRGKTIAEGVNQQPTERYLLRSYKVEEVSLPQRITCPVDVASNNRIVQQSRTFDKFWRISVVGDKVDFPDALIWHIWLDNTIVGATGAGKELVVIVYDRELLREGATVGVSYGRVGPEDTLSETLHFTSNTPTTPTPTTVPDAYAELRQRPLKTPPIAPGTPCPVSQGSRADSKFDWDVRYGSGPIYLYSSSEDQAPGSIGEDGTVELRYLGYREGSGAYMLKSPWIGDPTYAGRSLVRGHQLDGSGVVRFDYAWGRDRDEMRLEEANNIYTPDGWYFWNTGTLFPGPGCYALQVDGQHFTDVIVLQVVK